MATEGTFVNVPEAGRALGVSESTIWRMIRRGTLSSVRSGGRRLVPAGELERGKPPAAGDRIPSLTVDHPIFRLAGAGRSGGLTPGARDKHAILDQ